MKWTKALPTEPGWYWWRRPPGTVGYPVQVKSTEKGLMVTSRPIVYFVDQILGEWSDRKIEEPSA